MADTTLFDEVVATPEPTEADAVRAEELARVVDDACLRGRPFQDEHCNDCVYYLDGTADPSYCWHPELRMLVGGHWWCQWFDRVPSS